MAVLYKAFKSLAFRVDPEYAHSVSLHLLATFPKLLASFFPSAPLDDRFALQVGDLRWSFPVGLAAGLDKNAQALDFFTRLNFGAVEVGTVTPLPQAGNPRPRLWRLEGERSLRNNMGFNGEGAESVLRNIQKSSCHGKVLGVNLGKNKATPEEGAGEDYARLFQQFKGVADYLVVNVSSPNTPGLREFQRSEKLRDILGALDHIRSSEKGPPLYLKISPDLELFELREIVELAKEFSLQGIVATNTSASHHLGEGGLSGGLLRERAKVARQAVLECARETPDIQIIGVGGIENFVDLLEFWRAGGKVVQLYTSLIYQGPGILDKFYREIERFLEDSKASSLEDLLANINQV